MSSMWIQLIHCWPVAGLKNRSCRCPRGPPPGSHLKIGVITPRAASPLARTTPVRTIGTRRPIASGGLAASSHSMQTPAMKSVPAGLSSVSSWSSVGP